jgi:NADH:ubiquinone oxidoreductase subunit 5 (subunit L)/multisubunit Na+/H+ antiporter MnhA subunit
MGYNLVIFSGNFETLFVGWEILGICSLLLIAFYRDRYLPVKNALKVISFYRWADAALLLAMWMSHHLWHQNITFLKLNDSAFMAEHLHQHHSLGLFVSMMLLMAAAIKSAQFPFSSWLPRAMEGPTTSSAIFYGSLSVHLGVFILLRTFPLWHDLTTIRILVFAMGLVTGLVATGIAKVQSTVKTQIAYASAAQIGLMFVEIACGFHWLALLHFAGNAFLRTYQLLVSPSVLSYLVHHQFYHFDPQQRAGAPAFSRLKASLFLLSMKEWNLDFFAQRSMWSPFKWAGVRFRHLTKRIGLAVFVGLYIVGLTSFLLDVELPALISLPFLLTFLALILILVAFSEKGDARKAWSFILGSQLFIALAVGLNKDFHYHHILIYLSGGVVSSIIGYVCLQRLKAIDNDIELDRFHGYAYEAPGLALMFLLCSLGLAAFPITPAFIGFDLLLTHIHHDQFVLITAAALCFVFVELAILRMYARLFLGQHKKTDHAIAYRSS